MNINSALQVNFLGINKTKMSSPVKVFGALPCDTFVKTQKNNFTYANQKKLEENKFDSTGAMILLKSNYDLDEVIELSKTISNPRTSKIEFKKSEYDNDAYIMKSIDREGEKALLLDKDLKPQALEESSIRRLNEAKIIGPTKGFVAKNIKTLDYRTNTTIDTELLQDDKDGRWAVLKEIKEKKDSQDRFVRKETSELSDIPGVFNVKYEFPNGKTRVLSKAQVDKKTGHTVILKDMRSADMTRTQYRYEDDPQGNRIMEYKITSPDGKVLLKQSQTFEKISDDKYVSSNNGKIYDIQVDKTSINVTDRATKASKQVDLNNVFGKRESIVQVLKKLPGEQLMELADRVETLEGIDDSLKSLCKTSPDLWGEVHKTKSKLDVTDDMFIFLHELGHAIDSGNRDYEYGKDENGSSVFNIFDEICQDEDFIKTYSLEKQNYVKEFPEAQREHINYFLADEAVEGEKDRGRKETIAETNAILNSYDKIPVLGMRTQCLQQHFPRTIAYLSQKLTKW